MVVTETAQSQLLLRYENYTCTQTTCSAFRIDINYRKQNQGFPNFEDCGRKRVLVIIVQSWIHIKWICDIAVGKQDSVHWVLSQKLSCDFIQNYFWHHFSLFITVRVKFGALFRSSQNCYILLTIGGYYCEEEFCNITREFYVWWFEQARYMCDMTNLQYTVLTAWVAKMVE